MSEDVVQPDSTPEVPDSTPDPGKDLIHKDALSEWVKKYQEADKKLSTVQSEYERAKEFTLSPDEFQEWREAKEKRAQAAEERKKKDGKWEQILVEKQQEWTSQLTELKRQYEHQVEQEKSARTKLEQELHSRLVAGQVRAMLGEDCAEDVLDLAAQDAIRGSQYEITLDDNRDLVVIDRKTGVQPFTTEGPLSVKQYLQMYLDKRPSFKRSRIQPGSDKGQHTVPIVPPKAAPSPRDSDGTIPVAEYGGTAANLQLIRDGIKGVLPKHLVS